MGAIGLQNGRIMVALPLTANLIQIKGVGDAIAILTEVEILLFNSFSAFFSWISRYSRTNFSGGRQYCYSSHGWRSLFLKSKNRSILQTYSRICEITGFHFQVF